MGRPAKFSREKAIEIALETFWKRGYEATSVSELATAMSITRSSFYNCFKTRDALFEMVLERYQLQSPDFFLRSLPERAPVLPAIEEAFKNLCHIRANDPDCKGCLVINCLSELDQSAQPPKRLLKIMRRKLAFYEILIERAVEQKELPGNTNAKNIASAILTQMIGLNVMSKITPDEQTLWTIAAQFLTSTGLSKGAHTSH